ncbi:MAG: hypothetical protein ACOY94_07115 [Bacillota bacterium]
MNGAGFTCRAPRSASSLLGPGTTVTHAAVMTMAEAGCLITWCGEQGVRFYAQGMGETRSATRFLKQARLWASGQERLRIVRRMYEMRFSEPLPPDLTLRQIRGKEGARVRMAYAREAERCSYPVNRALSAANSCLYGVCHAVMVAAGYSPALGFIHTGKMLSFVYDVADLYKMELTVPAAFLEVARGGARLESRVRHRSRDLFAEYDLLKSIVVDLVGGEKNFEEAESDSRPDR